MNQMMGAPPTPYRSINIPFVASLYLCNSKIDKQLYHKKRHRLELK